MNKVERLKEEVCTLIDQMVELARKGEIEKARVLLRNIETELLIMMIHARNDQNEKERRLKSLFFLPLKGQSFLRPSSAGGEKGA